MKSKTMYLGWFKEVLRVRPNGEADHKTGEQVPSTAERTPQPPGAPRRIRRPRRAPVERMPDTPFFGASPRSRVAVRPPNQRTDSRAPDAGDQPRRHTVDQAPAGAHSRRHAPRPRPAPAAVSPPRRRPLSTIRREFPSLRVAVKPDVTFYAGGKRLGGPMEGVSHQFDGAGMRLLISLPNPRWAHHLLTGRIELSIGLPLPDQGPAVRLRGRVAWIESVECDRTPSALGVLFVDPSPETQRRLFRFMLAARSGKQGGGS